MILYGDVEFRGLNTRTSKEGKQYFMIMFEDLETSDQVRMYSRSDAQYTIPRTDLVKGRIYHCSFSYHFNSYENRWQTDLADIIECVDQES